MSANNVLVRVLRPLAAIGFLKEVNIKTWAPTPVTHAMATPEIAAGHRMIFELIHQAAFKAPRFLSETHYRCPTNPTDGLIQYAFQTKLPLFEFLASKPDISRDFNLFMGNTMGARAYWVDWFPVKERILDGANEGEVMMVDVGGGKGHDLVEFGAKFPGHKLLLQDLGEVVESAKAGLGEGIETMSYDFFIEQPVKGKSPQHNSDIN